MLPNADQYLHWHTPRQQLIFLKMYTVLAPTVMLCRRWCLQTQEAIVRHAKALTGWRDGAPLRGGLPAVNDCECSLYVRCIAQLG